MTRQTRGGSDSGREGRGQAARLGNSCGSSVARVQQRDQRINAFQGVELVQQSKAALERLMTDAGHGDKAPVLGVDIRPLHTARPGSAWCDTTRNEHTTVVQRDADRAPVAMRETIRQRRRVWVEYHLVLYAGDDRILHFLERHGAPVELALND